MNRTVVIRSKMPRPCEPMPASSRSPPRWPSAATTYRARTSRTRSQSSERSVTVAPAGSWLTASQRVRKRSRAPSSLARAVSAASALAWLARPTGAGEYRVRSG
ncbi:MAG: hypothetical protein QOG57_116 [Pseudonocardiales bacterium]|nr:hypothetical protein [Pseudonocardiales bacterium]